MTTELTPASPRRAISLLAPRRLAPLVLTGCLLLQVAVFFGLFAGKSFWLDEILSLDFTGGSLGALYVKVAGDLHPPGYFLLLWGWRRLLPPDETAMRLLSLLLALPALPLTYALVRRVASLRAALWSCVFLSLSAFHAQFAAEARMYSAFESMTLLATLLFLVAVTRPAPGRLGVGYALAMAACLYLHYYGMFVLAAHGIFLWLYRRGRPRGQWGAVYGLAGLVFLPWAVVFARQVLGGGSGWIQAVQPTGASVQFIPATLIYFNLGEWCSTAGSWPNLTLLYLVVPALAVGVWVALGRGEWFAHASASRPLVPASGILPVMFIVPFYLALTVSQHKSIFMSRYLICTLPFFYALMGMAVGVVRPRLARWLVGGVLATFLAAGLVLSAEMRPREDWRGAAEFIKSAVPVEKVRRFGAFCDEANAAECLRFYLERAPGGLPVGLKPAGGWSGPQAGALPPLLCLVTHKAEALETATLPGRYQRDFVRTFKGGIMIGFFHRLE